MSKLSKKLHRLVERGELTWSEFLEIEAWREAAGSLRRLRELETETRQLGGKLRGEQKKRAAVINHATIRERNSKIRKAVRSQTVRADRLGVSPKTLRRALQPNRRT